MGELFSAKLRKIGTSVGILLPKEQLENLNVAIGDEVEVALVKHRNRKEIQDGFGIAKQFKRPFERDKTTREF